MGTARQDLSGLQNGIAACTKCTVFREFGYWKFPSAVHGNSDSPIWIVGADPRRIDSALRKGEVPRYWMGASRRNLRDPIERHFGRRLEDLVYLTDGVKCQRPNNTIPSEGLQTCPPTWLSREISILRPIGVIALGKDAAAALRLCRKELKQCGTEVMHLGHPSPRNRTVRSWGSYRTEVIRILEGWRHLFPGEAS